MLSTVAITMMLSGCGSSNSSSNTPTTVTVERGPVFGATVTDAKGQLATTVKDTNKYTFASTPTYPITVTGGRFDANYDGKIDTNDFALPIVMKAENGLNITPMTTYFNDLNDTQEQAFATSNNLNIDELRKLPSDASGAALAAINAVFAALVQKVQSSIPANFNLENAFNEHFSALKELNIANDNSTSDNITETDLSDIEKIINDQLLNTLTDSEIEDDNDNTTSDNITG